MSFHYEVNGDKVLFNFDRVTTKAFAELLKRNEGEQCRIEDPFGSKTVLTGYLDEVVNIPGQHPDRTSTMWVVEVELKDIMDLRPVGEELTLPANVSYMLGNIIQGMPVFERVFKLSLTTSTNHEFFTDYQMPDITKASASWDHKKSVEFVLFQQKKVFVSKDFTELPWSEPSLNGASILIPTSKPDKNTGAVQYTELGLALDGWTYSSDLSSAEEYESMPLEEAMKFVQRSVLQANHNP